MLEFGLAVLMIGAGIGVAAYGMSLFIKSIAELASDATVKNLFNVAEGLYSIAGGLGAIALGSAAIPALIAVKALGLESIGGKKSESDQMSALQQSVDNLGIIMNDVKVLLSEPGVVYMDSRKVGDTLRLYGAYTGKINK